MRLHNRYLPREMYDIFNVGQITRDTSLEELVAVDFVEVRPQKSSQIHRHNKAETVLYVVKGSGTIIVGDKELEVCRDDRIYIGRGVFHGVRTQNSELVFISIQSPPILNKKTGELDLESLPKPL